MVRLESRQWAFFAAVRAACRTRFTELEYIHCALQDVAALLPRIWGWQYVRRVTVAVVHALFVYQLFGRIPGDQGFRGSVTVGFHPAFAIAG